MVEQLFFFILTIAITSATKDNKVYFDDVRITNSTTSYSDISTDCNLFGNEFEADYPTNELIINTTETGVYWVGAKISFKRNINPLGVRSDCNGTDSRSLDGCNRYCHGRKYFSYNEKSCSCINNGRIEAGLSRTQICKNQENGLCYNQNCVAYQRDVLDEDYLCDTYHFDKIYKEWIFTTRNCSLKSNYICDGDMSSSDGINSTWLEAEQRCTEKDEYLLQKANLPGEKFKDGNYYWVSFFRRKKIYWGKGGDKDVCAAITIFPNGSVSLVSRFCTEQLATLCYTHKLHRDHRNTTANDDSSPLGLIVGCCIGVLAVIAMFIFIIIVKRRNVKKRKLKYLESVIKDYDTEYDNPMEDISDHMYKSTDVTKPSCSDYSLAVTYSDPINSVLPRNTKSIPETEYESVGMVPSKKTQIYPVENPYQSPYS